jgi:hypothetical protein
MSLRDALNIADFNILFLGSKQNYTHFGQNHRAKIYCTNGEMAKLAPCQASSVQHYKEYN